MLLRSVLFPVLLVVLGATGLRAQQDPGIIPGDILVMLTPEGRAQSIAEDLRTLDGVPSGLRVDHEVSGPMRIWLLKFDASSMAQDRMLSAIKRHPMVMMAQNDHPVTFRQIPNDTQYGQQWHHPNIGSPGAWDVSTGGTTATGDEIVVCIIEGANLLHTDLAANRWLNTAEIPGNGIDDDGNGYVDDHRGWNPPNNNDNVYSGSHGTNVAGMIGAVGNNGIGVAGANWNVKMMVVTVGSLSQANVIASYTYPLLMRRRYNDSNGAQGAFVVATNASWGIDNANPNNYPLWCAIYDTLGTEGILNCGATANNNVNVDVVGDMPTACPSPFMVSVTATNSSNNRTFSGYGANTIDVGAPGEAVRTTSGSTGYTTTSGTSFASPLTAGVIGLLYSAPCPSLMGLVQSDPMAGAMYVRQKLFQGVDIVGNLAGQTVTGGRINANNSMQLIMSECGGSFCPVPGGLQAEEDGPTAVTLNWTGSAGQVFNLRYRPVGGAQWTEVNGLTSTSYPLTGLQACGSYEYAVQRVCAPGELSGFSTSVEWTLPGCCTPVTVVIATDRWGAETTWSITDGNTIFASGGPYTNAGSNGVYPRPSVEVCLPDGCYNLVVNDSYGDGMCCQYGAGSIVVEDADGQVLASAASFTYQQVVPFCVASTVRLSLRAILQGAFDGQLMRDDLRQLVDFPLTEPYTDMGYDQVLDGGGESTSPAILNVVGNDAVVDWVRIELRDATNPTVVVATRQALLQRDGDVVDASDGVSPVSFNVPPGEHHVLLEHRNHLGVMTAAPVLLGSQPLDLDLAAPGTSTWGAGARLAVGDARVLWAGDVSSDGVLRYTGQGNDRDRILVELGGVIPTVTVQGYLPSDVNLDGVTRYTGQGNDRDVILQNIGGVVPTASRVQQVP